MGKAYIDTVKYMVKAQAEIDGPVEKPDVVGAIFGQTEGLLGDELDLRELQKSGRIGRIEVDLRSQGGKITGHILLPSSLDRVETAVLAAALETVDRIGPCEAKIRVESIEDTRSQKRSQVVNRAKEILRSMITDVTPESKEISELVRDEVKTAEVQYYGPEKLACGPNIATAEHLIVVEGRADVLTLLKCDIQNVICISGKNVPKSVIDLSKQKEVTLFVDGDRGGDLIVKQMSELAEVDFVAKAPDGKEVEELMKKEIIKCLRHKMPLEQFMTRTFRDAAPNEYARHSRFERETPVPASGFTAGTPLPFGRPTTQTIATARPTASLVVPSKTENKESDLFKSVLKELSGTLRGALLDKEMNVLIEADVRDLAKEIEARDNINAIVFDGIITQRLVDMANAKNIKYIAGAKTAKIENKGAVDLITA